MSHSYGEVVLDGNVIGHFEFNGTCTVACTAIRSTKEEVREHWRSPENMAECTCTTPDYTDVTLTTDYGGGYEWPAKICQRCHAIVEGKSPDDREPDNGWR